MLCSWFSRNSVGLVVKRGNIWRENPFSDRKRSTASTAVAAAGSSMWSVDVVYSENACVDQICQL